MITRYLTTWPTLQKVSKGIRLCNSQILEHLNQCAVAMEVCEATSFSCSVPKWLNKDFMEKCLRLCAHDDQLCVTKFDVSPATAPGDNYVSELYRITTELLNKGEGQSVIIKCLPNSEYNLQFIRNGRLFEKEIYFYNVSLPNMCVSHLTPRCVYTQEDLLILEDLTPMGFKLVNRCDGLDFLHSVAAIKALASFHAGSLSIPTAELANKYPETIYHDKDHAYRYINHSLESLAGVVESWTGYERFAKIIHELSKTALDKILTLMSTHQDNLKHFVLNHGDFWTNNILFKYDGLNIQELKVIDFQMCRYSPLVLDLQYFIYTSVSETEQIDSQDALLEEYRTELCSLLKNEDFISKAELKAQMEKTDLFGFINACMMLPVVLSDPAKESPDLGNVADQPDQSQECSTDTLNWHTGQLFQRIFKKLLLHFERKGLFAKE